MRTKVPLLGFAAYSGTGKTSLLIKLIPLMKLQGLRVAMIKTTHHDFDIDKPGKDSYELRRAGADQVLLASSQRCAVMTEFESEQDVEQETNLNQLVNRLDLDNLDLIMVEGFKHSHFPKIELYRSEIGQPFMFPQDKSIVAIASDENIDSGNLPLLNLNEIEEIAGFINRWLELQKEGSDSTTMSRPRVKSFIKYYA